ncbi:MAG: hypothetical protein Q8M92_02390 [Candidatus Subteraquimicrobiales bacterium]|nr:hypothetical protein [Candidatus Subteraquimicrobiales bacterium]
MKENEIQEVLPKKPRKISDDLPEDTETFSEEAKLSRDTRNQYFVRFPRKVAEALGFDNVDKIEFVVKIPLPDAKPENTELMVRLIRK